MAKIKVINAANNTIETVEVDVTTWGELKDILKENEKRNYVTAMGG